MLRTDFRLVILALGALALRGAGSGAWAAPPSDPSAVIRFTEESHEAGIDLIHAFGDAHFSNLVEVVGSGAAWLDYDGDGEIKMYRVMGKYQAGVGCEGRLSMGVATGDSENDGWTDLYVADYGEKHPLPPPRERPSYRPCARPGGAARP